MADECSKRMDLIEHRIDKLEDKANITAVEVGVLGERMGSAVEKLTDIVEKLDNLVAKISNLEHFRLDESSKSDTWKKILIGVIIALGSAGATRLMMLLWK